VKGEDRSLSEMYLQQRVLRAQQSTGNGFPSFLKGVQEQGQQQPFPKTPESPSGLDSIAKAAAQEAAKASQLEDKLNKRRLQIAAASRKSRAKRKREMAELKDHNKFLEGRVAQLEKRLRLSPEAQEEPQADQPTRERSSSDGSSDHTESDSERPDENTEKTDPVVSWLQRKLNWYFKGIQDDALKFHRREDDANLRESLENIEVQLVQKPC